MAEIYRDSAVTLGLEVASAQDVSATVTLNGTEIFTANTPTFTIPADLLIDNGTLKVTWEFTLDGISTHRRYETHEVVTPYATVEELREYSPDIAVLTDEQIMDLESRARAEIYRITGQHFWTTTEDVVVYGEDEWTLNLPNRLIALDGVHLLNGDTYDLRDAGVFLKDEYTLGFSPAASSLLNTNITYGGVIYAPPASYGPYFRQDVAYVLTGTFGWDYVPGDITTATKMLVKDYLATVTEEYRQKGVKRLQTGTWSVEFTGASDVSTGNAEVDRILAAYRSPGMAVI